MFGKKKAKESKKIEVTEVTEALAKAAHAITDGGIVITPSPNLIGQFTNPKYATYNKHSLLVSRPASEVITGDDLSLFLELLDYLHGRCITGDLTTNDAIWGTVKQLQAKYVKGSK